MALAWYQRLRAEALAKYIAENGDNLISRQTKQNEPLMIEVKRRKRWYHKIDTK